MVQTSNFSVYCQTGVRPPSEVCTFCAPSNPVPFPESSRVSLDSQHPDALARIQTLESRAEDAAAAAASKETEASAAAGAPPAFAGHMTDVRCAEGEDIALECRVTPTDDPRLQIGK